MGCVCSKTPAAPPTLELLHSTSSQFLTAPQAYHSLRTSATTKWPELRYQAWYFLDQASAIEIRTPSQYTTFLGRIRSRNDGKLSVRVEERAKVEKDSVFYSALPAVFAVFGKETLHCNGVYIGKFFAVVPAAALATDQTLVFRTDSEEVPYQYCASAAKKYALGSTQSALLKLLPAGTQSAFFSRLPASILQRTTGDVRKGEKLVCFCHTMNTPVLRAVSCVVAGDPGDERFVVAGKLAEGVVGSPVFTESGSVAGLVSRFLEGDRHECLSVWKVIACIKTLENFPEADDLLKDVAIPPEKSRGSIDLNGISLEEDHPLPSILLHESPAIEVVARQRVQASEPQFSAFSGEFNIEEESEHSPVSVAPSPPSPPSIRGEVRAFFVNSVDGGSELWRIAKSDYALTKETGTEDVPKGCSLLDTPQGLMVIGGEEAAGRKVWVWTKSGLNFQGELKHAHTKHSSVLLGRHVYVISGSATSTVEIFDIWTSTPASVHPLSKPRYQAGACSVSQHSLFLAGGFVGTQGRPSRSILEYRVHKDEWTKIALKLSSPVTAVGLVYLAPMTLLIIGGRSAQGVPLTDAYLLDLQSNVRIASLVLPEPATFAHTHPVRDDDSLVMFTDSKLRFEYDIRRQRFYLLSV